MAETTKKKTGRPKKKVEEPIIETTNEEMVEKTEEVIIEDAPQNENDALASAMELIAKMQEELNALKAEKTEQVVIAPTPSAQSKKIKCVSISHHPVNVSTQPKLNGKVFKFGKYGQVVQMKYDELLEVLAAYPNTMETGLIYICDKDVVEDNGLADAYAHIYDKETMDKIVYLREESDADLIVGMNDELRESTIIKVIELYKSGERMDANALAILREHDIDIVELAKEITVS